MHIDQRFTLIWTTIIINLSSIVELNITESLNAERLEITDRLSSDDEELLSINEDLIVDEQVVTEKLQKN